jgi:choline kinase
MKAVILAAGRGSRLKSFTENIPKALLSVNGIPIIIQQVENLRANGIADIAVVGGYEFGKLIKTLNEHVSGIYCTVNDEYAVTHNMFSSLCVRNWVDTSPFIMLNGDVFFDQHILSELLSFKYSNAILVDYGVYFGESMKVTHKHGMITSISKDIEQKDALGSSIDIYKFSSQGASEYFSECNRIINKQHKRRLWCEVAINNILKSVEFKACPFWGRWIEIDTIEDLRQAELLFKERKFVATSD